MNIDRTITVETIVSLIDEGLNKHDSFDSTGLVFHVPLFFIYQFAYIDNSLV